MLTAQTLNVQTPGIPADLPTLLKNAAPYLAMKKIDIEYALAYLTQQDGISQGLAAQTVNQLATAASCWNCLTPEQVDAILIYLRCAEVNAGDEAL